jgi:hypothetical protein
MRRSFFFAVGLFVLLVGAQCLAVEKFVLKARMSPPKTNAWLPATESAVGPHRELIPPEWAPWTLMSTGAVVSLYSCTIYRSKPAK